MKDRRYSPPFRPMVSAALQTLVQIVGENDLDAPAVVNGIENRRLKTSGYARYDGVA